jgi:acylphosphatase
MIATRIEVFGQVQGVGFRAFVTRYARARGLRGWVRNRRDGSVEALLIGEPASVEAMIEQCRRGPPLARVDRVDRVENTPAQDDGTPDFDERATV